MRARLHACLDGGEPLLGTMVFTLRGPALVPICAAAGADFVVLDQEATAFSLETLEVAIAAGRGLPTSTVVRVAATRAEYLSRALDIGADGVMVPAVEDADHARAIVAMVKYPPTGNRGVMSGLAGTAYRPDVAIAETLSRANHDSVVIAQIETATGVANADQIAAVTGVDVLLVGSLDLSVSLGRPGAFRDPSFVAAVDAVAAAAQAHGKVAATKVGTVADGRWWLERGYRCLIYADDVRLFRDGMVAGFAALRAPEDPAAG